jgi:hypothetical protein
MIKPREIDYAAKSPALASVLIEEAGPRILEIIEAARAKPLNRYNVRPGRIFGKLRGKERYRIIELTGNTIIYKDLTKQRVEYEDVDILLELWNLEGVVEISPVDEVLAIIKKWLTPILGPVLIGALLSWVLNKVGR